MCLLFLAVPYLTSHHQAKARTSTCRYLNYIQYTRYIHLHRPLTKLLPYIQSRVSVSLQSRRYCSVASAHPLIPHNTTPITPNPPFYNSTASAAVRDFLARSYCQIDTLHRSLQCLTCTPVPLNAQHFFFGGFSFFTASPSFRFRSPNTAIATHAFTVLIVCMVRFMHVMVAVLCVYE